MKKEENIKDELAGMAPFLIKMKAENDGLKVPENYFHNLTIEVMEEVKADRQIAEKEQVVSEQWFVKLINQLRFLLQPQPMMALASILILVVAGLFFIDQPSNSQESLVLSDISIEALDLYLEENIEDFDSEMLVEGNEQILQEGFELEDELDVYLEEILEETDLEDLL